ncbi:hypothetical protein JXA85_04160 [Candidatus Woesearchaeota archaeon]|nr:hypothetical protein [Candidatus Woesearchaeota archaeon]
MPVRCKMCTGNFHQSPDSLVLCRHHGGFVHLGCCINVCSWNKQPCEHCMSTFEKL